jgi:hypothetical protein
MYAGSPLERSPGLGRDSETSRLLVFLAFFLGIQSALTHRGGIPLSPYGGRLPPWASAIKTPAKAGGGKREVRVRPACAFLLAIV